MSLHYIGKLESLICFLIYKCDNLKHVSDHKNESVMFNNCWYCSIVQQLLKCRSFARTHAWSKDVHATRQLHYQVRYNPFHGKDSASAACFTSSVLCPAADDALLHGTIKSCSRQNWGRVCSVTTDVGEWKRCCLAEKLYSVACALCAAPSSPKPISKNIYQKPKTKATCQQVVSK